MSEMVDRVEDEIMMAMNGDPKGGSFSRAAYAAIKAMREPTRDMLSAFVDADTSFDDAKTRWESAIDAALSEVEG